jgi:broad specificity phosphatase PhoE
VDSRSTLIYLLRHGEVEQAATRRFIGHLDVPLSEHGLRQCVAQGTRLQGVALAGVFASDLTRARRSGEILGAPHGLTPTLLPALREMAMGRWEGLTAEQIRAREPDAFARWMARVDAFAFPDGESLTDLLDRAWPAFQSLVAAHTGQRIAVAAHGGTNRVLLCRALGLPLQRILSLGQDYGALTILEHTEERWRLRRLNEPPRL